jgi:hypothetical protein
MSKGREVQGVSGSARASSSGLAGQIRQRQRPEGAVVGQEDDGVRPGQRGRQVDELGASRRGRRARW